MSCDRIRPMLTGYLEGDLASEDGSIVRGHLRECAECRRVASDEAALRDGLRQLPPVDPPASLWAGVQAQLAAAEVADARRPAWRRAVARWMPAAPRFAAAGLVAAAAITLLWWRAHRGPADDVVASQPPVPVPAVAPAPLPERVVPPPTPTSPGSDVTADLAGEGARTTSSYDKTAEELLALATEARPQWSADEQRAFDARVAELRGAIDRSTADRPRQRAWGELIKYLQGAVVRDDIALAGGGR